MDIQNETENEGNALRPKRNMVKTTHDEITQRRYAIVVAQESVKRIKTELEQWQLYDKTRRIYPHVRMC
jgi:hypothetical protein